MLDRACVRPDRGLGYIELRYSRERHPVAVPSAPRSSVTVPREKIVSDDCEQLFVLWCCSVPAKWPGTKGTTRVPGSASGLTGAGAAAAAAPAGTAHRNKPATSCAIITTRSPSYRTERGRSCRGRLRRGAAAPIKRRPSSRVRGARIGNLREPPVKRPAAAPRRRSVRPCRACCSERASGTPSPPSSSGTHRARRGRR